MTTEQKATTLPTDAMNLPPNGPGITAAEVVQPVIIDPELVAKQDEAASELARKAERSTPPHRSERPHSK